MQSRWKINTVSLGAWFNNGLEKISKIKREHSSSLYTLLRYIINKPNAWILAHPEYPLDPIENKSLNSALTRLISGEPLAYIVNSQSFFGLEFYVNPNVLIPRPETEMLVDEAIRIAKRYTFKNKISIADVGTGSGCIAISLIKTIPNSEVIATDINYKALTIASRNIQRYDIEHRVHLVQTSLLNGIENKFDLICANLPYIPTNKLMGLSDLKYEPFQALDGGPEGLDLINRLLEDIKNKIQPGGTIFLEIESTQKQNILNMCNSAFPKSSKNILNDLARQPRLAIINFTE